MELEQSLDKWEIVKRNKMYHVGIMYVYHNAMPWDTPYNFTAPVIYLFIFSVWSPRATVNGKKPFLPVFWTEFDDIKSVDE